MQLTMSAEYAIRTMLNLASRGENTIVSITKISEAESVPEKFLRNIVRSLVQQGLVMTHRGTSGGLSLVKPPSTITLLDIIEAIEGPISLHKCLIDHQRFCDRTACCSVHRVWQRAQSKMKEELTRHTLAELVDQHHVLVAANQGSCIVQGGEQ